MNSKTETHLVPEDIQEIRVDRYAAEIFTNLNSRKSAKKAIKRGELRVNGVSPDPFQRVRAGQVLELDRPKDVKKPVFRLKLEVIYEDDWLAVIEKPPGFEVKGNKFFTIENALPHNMGVSGRKDALAHPVPVHRLDFSTGGLLIIARTSSALVKLGRQFQERLVKKRYTALVSGQLMGSGSFQEPVDGRNAHTDYRALMHFPSLQCGWVSLVNLWPVTGRRHQIRKHLSGAGHPVLGDSLYGEKGRILKSKGLFLWSTGISLCHPVEDRPLDFSIDIPPKFHSYISREKRRWSKYFGE